VLIRRPEDVSSSYFRYGRETTIAGQFIPVLQAEERLGNASYETERHLKHEFRSLDGRASGLILVAAVEAEIDRLEWQATTLRRLRDGILGAT